jgi:hypothetical protein
MKAETEVERTEMREENKIKKLRVFTDRVGR